MALRGFVYRNLALLVMLYALCAQAQLSGRVGPTTSRESKRQRICNVLDYGGSVGSSVRVTLPRMHLSLIFSRYV